MSNKLTTTCIQNNHSCSTDPSKPCYTITLDDKPSDTDHFADQFKNQNLDDFEKIGPYERIALNIAQIINPDEDHPKPPKGGCLISIEGPWGSGKSTIVKILKTHLDKITKKNKTENKKHEKTQAPENKHPEFDVFTFNVNTHEGDPLRTAFLEQLIDHYIKIKWIKLTKKEQDKYDEKQNPTDIDWPKEKEELNQIKQTTEPGKLNLTFKNFFFALTILLMTIGSYILSKTISETEEIHAGLKFTTEFKYGITFLLSPILLLISCVFISKTYNFLFRKKYEFKISPTQGLSHFTSSPTISTTSPTATFFENTFKNIIKEILTKNSKRKIIIVIENLDRVNPKRVNDIWTSLKTFIHEPHTNKQDNNWLNSVYFITPIATEKLQFDNTIYLQEDHDNNDDKSNITTDTTSFLNKNFTHRNHVPMPILSKWKIYFYKQLKNAYPNHQFPSNEKDKIYLLYTREYHLHTKQKQQTPRDIKHFINMIGFVHSQWYKTYPLSHIAAFKTHAKLQNAIKTNDANMISEIFLGIQTLDHDPAELNSIEQIVGDEDLRKNLAGLTYNLSPNAAEEIILTNNIISAINNKNENLFDLHYHKNNTCFWNILNQQSQLIFNNLEYGSTIKAYIFYLNSKAYQEASEQKIQFDEKFTTILIENLLRDHTHAEENKKDISNLTSQIKKLNSKELYTKIIYALGDYVSKKSKTGGSNFNLDQGLKYLDVMLTLTKQTQIQWPDLTLKKSIKFHILNFSDWINFCSKLSEIDPDHQIASYMTTDKPPIDFRDELKKSFKPDSILSLDIKSVLYNSRQFMSNEDWHNFICSTIEINLMLLLNPHNYGTVFSDLNQFDDYHEKGINLIAEAYRISPEIINEKIKNSTMENRTHTDNEIHHEQCSQILALLISLPTEHDYHDQINEILTLKRMSASFECHNKAYRETISELAKYFIKSLIANKYKIQDFHKLTELTDSNEYFFEACQNYITKEYPTNNEFQTLPSEIIIPESSPAAPKESNKTKDLESDPIQ